MGMGAEGGAGASAGTGEVAGLGPYAAGGGGTGASLGDANTGGAGHLAALRAFMSDPKNVQMLGQILQQGSHLSSTVQKLPPDAQQFFRAAMGRALSGGTGGAPSLGALQPTQGPYMGDASSYNIDPVIARSVLSRMGIA